MDSLRKIGVIARSLDSISNIEFKEYELSKGQYLYLVRIGEKPGIFLQQISSYTRLKKEKKCNT